SSGSSTTPTRPSTPARRTKRRRRSSSSSAGSRAPSDLNHRVPGGLRLEAAPLAEEADRVAEVAEAVGVLPAEPDHLLEVEPVAGAEQVAVGGAQLPGLGL